MPVGCTPESTRFLQTHNSISPILFNLVDSGFSCVRATIVGIRMAERSYRLGAAGACVGVWLPPSGATAGAADAAAHSSRAVVVADLLYAPDAACLAPLQPLPRQLPLMSAAEHAALLEWRCHTEVAAAVGDLSNMSAGELKGDRPPPLLSLRAALHACSRPSCAAARR